MRTGKLELDLAGETIDLGATLADLAHTRPLFHSEADFQHALAWKLREKYPSLKIRLEVPMNFGVVDILLSASGQRVGLELKYGRGAYSCVIEEERYTLREHPPPVVRDEFWKDVQRLEIGVRGGEIAFGIAICLTNHDGCWTEPRKRTTQDAIRFHHGLRAPRVMKLDPRPRSDKEFPPLLLGADYVCEWRDYSTVAPERFGELRYLAVLVDRPDHVSLP